MNSMISLASLNYLRDGWIRKCWDKVSSLLIKLISPKLAALFCYWTIDWGLENDGPTLLCLFRESFIKDIEELRKNTSLNLPVVMGGFTRFQMGWVPREMQIQTFYQGYRGINRDRAIARSRVFAERLIQLVRKKRRVDGILSANFDYWQDTGFKEVCREKGIPFLVLSREHPVIPKVCEEVVRWYTEAAFVFEGNAIAVAGSSTKEVMMRVSNLCDESKMVITGLPRYDAWRIVDCSTPPAEREFVTLLTFASGYYADATFKEVLRAFLESAQEHSNQPVKFLVKTKDFSDTSYLKSILPSGLSSNVICGHDFPLPDVLPRSRLTVNYNSLSLVEAAMARTPIVLPAWGECHDRGSDVMYSIENTHVQKVAAFAYDSEMLKAIMRDNINGVIKTYGEPEAQAFISDFIYVPQGKTYSEEFMDFCKTNLQTGLGESKNT
ncbi:MAG: hypothetical protein FJ116_01675 [Deltaproteobacteria bacterium]|nr:hypothetical protein [Deltaproteobacteria bacterium]